MVRTKKNREIELLSPLLIPLIIGLLYNMKRKFVKFNFTKFFGNIDFAK